MSEIDHTNSLDPDQAQQNVWQDPQEKGSVRFKKCLGQKKTLLSMQRQKRCYIWNTMIRVGYNVTYDHFCSL